MNTISNSSFLYPELYILKLSIVFPGCIGSSDICTTNLAEQLFNIPGRLG